MEPLNSGYILKAEPAGFSDGPDDACERRRRVKDDSKIVDWETGGMGSPLLGWGGCGRSRFRRSRAIFRCLKLQMSINHLIGDVEGGS